MGALKDFRSTFEKAVKAWNADSGPLEHTIKAGENLYFAAHNLIDELTEQRKDLSEALSALYDSFDSAVALEPKLLANARAALARATGSEA